MSARPLALVTGASRGVGAAIARALAPSYDLLLGGRDAGALAGVAARLAEAAEVAGAAEAVGTETVGTAEAVEARPWPVELTAVTEADVAGIDRLDVLVHSAGVATLGTIAQTPAEVWRRTLEVNVIAAVELTRLLLPALRAARGHVVLINSGAGQRANPRWGSYAASKFALRAFADALRQEEPGLRVTSVYPGRVGTDMQRGVRAQEGAAYEPEKYLSPGSVARVVLAAVTASPDAHVTEITVRPSAGPVT